MASIIHVTTANYPESDGKPMGETDLHRDEMVRQAQSTWVAAASRSVAIDVLWPVAINMQHTDVGQIANLPRFRQVRNLPHVADFLRRAIPAGHGRTAAYGRGIAPDG